MRAVLEAGNNVQVCEGLAKPWVFGGRQTVPWQPWTVATAAALDSVDCCSSIYWALLFNEGGPLGVPHAGHPPIRMSAGIGALLLGTLAATGGVAGHIWAWPWLPEPAWWRRNRKKKEMTECVNTSFDIGAQKRA